MRKDEKGKEKREKKRIEKKNQAKTCAGTQALEETKQQAGAKVAWMKANGWTAGPEQRV